jgi:cytochrome bd ubiquinol oxidase subunit II
METYEILRLAWWVLLGILLIGFAVMDGFDLGTAALLPFVAKNDIERRVAINTVGPVWEGHQVWFILGGGAIFAAWPALYGASFSGFYLAMFLALATLILRPVGFKFRGKIDNPAWKRFWDWALFSGGVVPTLIFGVAFGNLFKGVPFTFDDDLRFHSTITLFSLLNPFALLCGLVSLSMIVLHGACWLNLKTEGNVKTRAAAIIPYAAVVYGLLFVLAGFWLIRLPGFSISSPLIYGGPSNPTLKTVSLIDGGWLSNFHVHPALWVLVAAAYLGAASAAFLRRRPILAFLGSALAIAGTIATAGVALFPFLLPSSSNPAMSLTVWDASSSKLTLAVMLGAVMLMLPVILAYTSFAYYVLRGPVKPETITNDPHTSY